jgi:hypothetical protein
MHGNLDAMQVALAYSGSTGDVHPRPAPPALPETSQLSSPISSVRNSSVAAAPTSLDFQSPKTAAKFYHVYVNVKAFAATPCAPGELAELYFSLFNKTDSRYLTEEYCVVLDHTGSPVRESEGHVDRMKMLFRDLSQHDIQDQIFLVCRIIKNSSVKLATAGTTNGDTNGGLAPPPVKDTASIVSNVSNTGVDFGLGTASGMLTIDRDGKQSFRRPFGCAVLEISQFNRSDSGLDSQEYQMPIFVPVNEASFASIHEDIISSRIKDIEKSPRADYVGVNVRIMYGEASALTAERPELLSRVTPTSRLGFPDVTFPEDERNEVYLKLWSGDFASTSASGKSGKGLVQLGGNAKNVEVTAEVRTRDGALVERALSRGAGEPNVTQYHSTVFKANSNPSTSLPRLTSISS